MLPEGAMLGWLTQRFGKGARRVVQSQPGHYVYQLRDEQLGFDEGVALLRERVPNRVTVGAVDITRAEALEQVRDGLRRLGVKVRDCRVDVQRYRAYLAAAGYAERYPSYYAGNFHEKTLEHFLCFDLLQLRADDVFVDIASEHSPVAEIYSRLSGCDAYSQDIMYPPGVHGRVIGSSAAALPVADGFFSAVIATCSIEHFEDTADIDFLREASRILGKGGRLVIAPLYLAPAPACQTDPLCSIPAGVRFDPEAEIYCAQGWGNRHGRFYSPQTLVNRLLAGNRELDFVVHCLENHGEVDASVYCRYLLEGVKR